MNITILGHVCIDQNQSENTTYTSAGGSAIFIDKIYSFYSDWHTTIITPYGSDFIPYAKDLRLLPKAPSEEKTAVYQNSSNASGRMQKAFNRPTAFNVKITNEIKHVLGVSDIIIVAPLFPNIHGSDLHEFLDAVPAGALKVLHPQGYFRHFDTQNRVIPRSFKEWSDIVSLFDIITVSRSDKPEITKDIQRWIHTYPILQVVMTMADEGATLFTSDTMKHVPTVPIPHEKIVDSVGSGDIFTAALVYRYKYTNNMIDAISYANRVASECLKYAVSGLHKVFDTIKFK